ncbi:MAG: DUF4974 domain-containing protein [Carboxylicivirga sp.]|nr:DUF4974 domain-containing protein [Carboxylicivirga sp.]
MKESLNHIVQEIVGGKITAEEIEEFRNSFLDSDNEQIIKQALKTHLNEINDEDEVKFDHDQLYLIIKTRIKQLDASKKRHTRIVFLKKWMKVAVIVCIGIIIGVLTNDLLKNASNNYTSVIKANNGSVAQATLPDGTLIYLNAESKIVYNPLEWDKYRKVELEGEAWFDVKSDKDDPFVVHTQFYDVIVTGTRFNVKAYELENMAVTTLEEGKVTIIQDNENGKKDDITLKSGQQYAYNIQQRKGNVHEVKSELYSTWRSNKLIFINMSLEEMIQGFERKYGVEIIVADSELLNYHYDGVFENESIIEVLELLKLTWPIKYSIRGQKIIIRKKHNNKLIDYDIK